MGRLFFDFHENFGDFTKYVSIKTENKRTNGRRLLKTAAKDNLISEVGSSKPDPIRTAESYYWLRRGVMISNR